MKLGKLLGAIVTTAKANPALVIAAVSAVAPLVKAVNAGGEEEGVTAATIRLSMSAHGAEPLCNVAGLSA